MKLISSLLLYHDIRDRKTCLIQVHLNVYLIQKNVLHKRNLL